MISNLKVYFKKGVSVCVKAMAYAKAVLILVKSVYNSKTGNEFYEVTFSKIGRKWYCDVPGFPKELFEHTLMVGGANKFLEYYSHGETRIKTTIKIANEIDDNFFCGSRLYKTQSTLTGGAFYRDASGNFDEEIWLCPVTLFLFGKYPDRILIYRINNNVLSCPIYFK